MEMILFNLFWTSKISKSEVSNLWHEITSHPPVCTSVGISESNAWFDSYTKVWSLMDRLLSVKLTFENVVCYNHSLQRFIFCASTWPKLHFFISLYSFFVLSPYSSRCTTLSCESSRNKRFRNGLSWSRSKANISPEELSNIFLCYVCQVLYYYSYLTFNSKIYSAYELLSFTTIKK